MTEINSNIPRLLNESEIEDIIKDSIPEVLSASEETSAYARKKIEKRLREQLKEIIITPLAIQDLKKEIRKYFDKSLINPGTSVGIMAAEALSHPITQMVLNSFKSSGMAKQLVTGVDKARSLIYISKTIKNASCKVFFKKRYTFEEIYFEKYKEIVGISVGQLVDDYQIINAPTEEEQPWWYKYFTRSESSLILKYIKTGRIKKTLRLKLRRSLLYLHRLTTKKVADVIEDNSISSETKEKNIMCIYSPTMQGIIDVYIIEDYITASSIRDESKIYMYFSVNIIPGLDKIYVSGIPEIKDFTIDKINIKTPFINEVKINDSTYLINLSPNISKASGITPEHYKKVFEKINGIQDISINDFSIKIIIDPEILNKSPMSYLEEVITKEDEEEEKFDEVNEKEFFKHSDIYKDYYIYYIETIGTNLRALIHMKDIDTSRLVSNDPNEMFQVFGIETARNFLINELIITLSMDKSYIDPRHIILLVDFQTYLGVLTPATYSGVQRQPIGALSKATFEKPLDIFKKKAPFGQIEEVKSVSAAVALGCPVPLGTGKIKVEEDIENMRAKKALQEIKTIPCENLDNKVVFEIENEKGFTETKEIELDESKYNVIGAEIQKEIEKAKEAVKPKLPDVSAFIKFFSKK